MANFGKGQEVGIPTGRCHNENRWVLPLSTFLGARTDASDLEGTSGGNMIVIQYADDF